MIKVFVSHDDLRDFCRNNLTVFDLYNDYNPFASGDQDFSFTTDEPYDLQAEDILSAYDSAWANHDDEDTFAIGWFMPLIVHDDRFQEVIHYNGLFDAPVLSPDFLPVADADVCSFMAEQTSYYLQDKNTSHSDEEEPISFPDFLSQMHDYATLFRQNRTKPLREREFPTVSMLTYTHGLDEVVNQHGASEDQLFLFRKFTHTLADKGALNAMRIMGYACCEGNDAFKADGEKAEELLRKLYESTSDITYASVLGQLYYYGLSTKGKPQYDKALPYLTMATLNGDKKAGCLLMDMYENGKGVVRNEELPDNYIRKQYHAALSDLQAGNLTTELGRIALRLAKLLIKDNSYTTMDVYAYLLEAEYAENLRRKIVKDPIEHDDVLAEVDALKEQIIPYLGTKKGFHYTSAYPDDLHDMVSSCPAVLVRYSTHEDGSARITAQPLSKEPDMEADQFLLTIPEREYVHLVKKLVYRTGTDFQCTSQNDSFIVTDIREGPNHTVQFFFLGQLVAEIRTGKWTINLADPDKEKQVHLLLVLTSSPTRPIITVRSEQTDIRSGDHAIIQQSDGITNGLVVLAYTITESELPLSPSAYPTAFKVNE